MSSTAPTIDPSSFVFGGRLVATTDEFSVFESSSGRVLKLTGIARAVCERSVGTRLQLGEVIGEIGLEPGLAQQLQNHLVGLRLFHEDGLKGWFKKYLRFRYDLPVIPGGVVSWLCRGVEVSWGVLSVVTAVLLLASFAFLMSYGGIPWGFPQHFSYQVCMTAIVVNTFLHEMGHAYALYHFGQKPGAIGLRIMGPFLAAYTDVNGAWALAPKQRALVSIGGLSVQVVTTVVLCVALFLLHSEATAIIFFWATVFTMIYMALPMRENDGDWFIKDMIEHTPHLPKKRALYVLRKCFAVAGLVFFLHLISRGWRITYAQLHTWKWVLDGSLVPHLVRIAFLGLGTWSMVTLCVKEYREITGRLRGWWKSRQTVES